MFQFVYRQMLSNPPLNTLSHPSLVHITGLTSEPASTELPNSKVNLLWDACFSIHLSDEPQSNSNWNAGNLRSSLTHPTHCLEVFLNILDCG